MVTLESNSPVTNGAAQSNSIVRRKVDFDFDPQKVPVNYYGDDPIQTLVMTALSNVFPEGERFFVDSVMYYKEAFENDPELSEAVKGFAGQEGYHARAHTAFNTMARAQGLEVAVDLERKVKHLLRFRKKDAPPEARLAVTCALEHFTAIMAEQLLTDEEHRNRLHPSVRDLWVWHALEESEHKAVAFDVFNRVCGSYAVRARVMILTTLFFVGFVTYSHLRMCKARGVLGDVRGHLRNIDYLWIRKGLFRKLIPAYLDYFRPNFHPNSRNTHSLLHSWRDRLFGETGTLRNALSLS
ncbi:MAG: metal-dependent hydrolase [Polyangiaceae bacterium]|nr:metal-dependent hydrolase [Polyangiaceae bacterium]